GQHDFRRHEPHRPGHGPPEQGHDGGVRQTGSGPRFRRDPGVDRAAPHVRPGGRPSRHGAGAGPSQGHGDQRHGGAQGQQAAGADRQARRAAGLRAHRRAPVRGTGDEGHDREQRAERRPAGRDPNPRRRGGALPDGRQVPDADRGRPDRDDAVRRRRRGGRHRPPAGAHRSAHHGFPGPDLHPGDRADRQRQLGAAGRAGRTVRPHRNGTGLHRGAANRAAAPGNGARLAAAGDPGGSHL
ncbi:MAG: hypothetical protein, INTERPRO-suggestion: probable ferritin-like, partial [uncultured Ramlibacter sp.]